MKEIVRIQMFHSFRIQYKGEDINVTKLLGKQLINLFQLLMLNVGKDVSRDDLMEILYPDSEDPRNVLKFSVFRLRKALKEIPVLADLDFIQTTRNGYRISQEIEFDCDFKRFEQVLKTIENCNEVFDGKEVEYGKELIDIYEGHLYLTSNASIRVGQICEWYRSKFASCIVALCKSLLKTESFQEMLELDYSAIIKEPFYEGLHYYYMKALIGTRDYHKALKYYDDINEAFYKELGIGLSIRFKELYDVVATEYKKVKPITINQVYEDLMINNKQEGGLFCSYEMFKYIFEYSTKGAPRNDKHYYLILLELNNKNYSPENEMALTNKLKAVIETSIRCNDIFTRANNYQYVLLVECQNEDNVYIITQRISNSFYRKLNRNLYRLNYSVKFVI